MTQEKQVNEYKGFSLFNDVDEAPLRTHNRARILANIAQDNTNKLKRISANGAGLIMGYFLRVPEGERASVRDAFATLMKKDGYELSKV